MRLIDELTLQRELFCKIQRNAINSGICHFDSYKNWCIFGSEVEKAINDIFSETGTFYPTIDAVEVVRCKDCYFVNCYAKLSPRYECTRMLGSLQVKPDDFCSYGKRRGE